MSVLLPSRCLLLVSSYDGLDVIFLCNFRDTILKLLLDGARELGHIVCTHIRALLNELHALRRRPEATASQVALPSASSDEAEAEGVDRSKGLLMVRVIFKNFIICLH